MISQIPRIEMLRAAKAMTIDELADTIAVFMTILCLKIRESDQVEPLAERLKKIHAKLDHPKGQ